ncbi:MAG: hypothetical protein Q4E46_02070 [Candidatus Saccharibacteria bacterium]|nr:hypothetical protein [Candidatus Saccharibacteria bacterium]
MQRKIFAILLTLIMAFSLTSVTAFAAEVEPPADDPIVETEYVGNFYANVWSTIYSGTGSVVNITVTNNSAHWISVSMYNYSGDQVWYQQYSIAPNAQSSYYVGTDIASVRVRGVSGSGSVSVSVYPA